MTADSDCGRWVVAVGFAYLAGICRAWETGLCARRGACSSGGPQPDALEGRTWRVSVAVAL